MFKEFAIILCAVGIVCAGKARAPRPTSVPANTDSNTAHQTHRLHDLSASPTVSPYQSVTYSPKSTYEVDPAIVKSVSGPVSIVPNGVSTVQSYGSTDANQQFAVYAASEPSGPVAFADYLAASAAPITPYYSVPVAAKTVNIESRGAVQLHPPPTYDTQSTVQSYGVVQSHNNAVGTYPVYYVNAAANIPAPQYVSAPAIKYTVNPATGIVTLSAVPTAPQYATAPAQASYVPVPVSAANPISVPIVYQTSGLQTQQPTSQQFVVGPTAATYAQSPLRAQSFSVPLQFQVNSDNRYQLVPISVGNAKSFAGNVYAPVNPTPTPVAPTGEQYADYARANQYSPAPSVSQVKFNGLGVRYGW